MVAVALSSLIMAGVLSTALQVMRSGVRITEYAEMESQVRTGLAQLGHDLRNASGITLNGPGDLTLTVPTADGSTRQVTYAWTASTQSLFEVPGTDSSVVAGRITLVRGIPPQAGGSPGVTFVRLDPAGQPAATDGAAKLIRVDLSVSRGAGSEAAVTEQGVSATFALRNKAVQ